MRALTVWQPWASLIAYEAKPFEFRKWPAPDRLCNQRIAIHAGKRAARKDEIRDLIYRLEHEDGEGTALKAEIALPLLQRVLLHPGSMPHSAVVCTAFMSRPRKASALFGGQVADSDRIEQHIWGWPLSDVQRLEPPEPAAGKQGFWHWQPPTGAERTLREIGHD